MEKRYRAFDVAVRADDLDTGNNVNGYACVFDSPSVDLGGFTEIIKPGAFTETLASDDLDVIANIDHDNDRMLARLKPSMGANTLTLTQDDHGLSVAFAIPDTADGQFIRYHLKAGNIKKMSFCFVPIEEQLSEDGTTREIVKASLHDVAIVIFPAYEATEVELRAKQAATLLALRRKQILVRSKLFGIVHR